MQVYIFIINKFINYYLLYHILGINIIRYIKDSQTNKLLNDEKNNQ